MLWNKLEKKKQRKHLFVHWKTWKVFYINNMLADFISIHLPATSSYQNSLTFGAFYYNDVVIIFQRISSHREVFLKNSHSAM